MKYKIKGKKVQRTCETTINPYKNKNFL